MSRTLNEINDLIEAEVVARMRTRMEAFADKLRDVLAEIDGDWDFGGRVQPERPPNTDVVLETGGEMAVFQDTIRRISEVGRSVSLTEPAAASEAANASRGGVLDGITCKDDFLSRVPLYPSHSEIPSIVPAFPEQNMPLPDGSPDWLQPALGAAKALKVRTLLNQLAADGGITVNSVIYAFRPPMKEAYAMNMISDVRRCLKAAGWDLVRDNAGNYQARIAQ